MNLKDRWQAPTPAFWKKVIRISLILSAGSVALLMADTIGKSIMPDFSYKLLPITTVICKNIFVGGLVIAAMSKFAKENKDPDTYAAPKDQEQQNK